MELRTLKYFVTVAEELNITKAAKILCMCQPPLSAQIKGLEDELGTTLFIRNKRHLELTKSGQVLYRKAKEILALADQTVNEVESINKGITGTISIGLVEGMAPNIAASWISEFIALYPKVTFKIHDGNSDALIDKVRSGLISLAVITSPFDQTFLNSFKVGEEKMVALMSKNHPLAQNGENAVSISQLVGEPLIVPSRQADVDSIYRWFRNIHKTPNIICEMDSYLDACALAGKEAGISIFTKTEYVPNDSLVSKELIGAEKHMEYFFAWRKGHQLPTLEETFIDFVKAKIKESEIKNE